MDKVKFRDLIPFTSITAPVDTYKCQILGRKYDSKVTDASNSSKNYGKLHQRSWTDLNWPARWSFRLPLISDIPNENPTLDSATLFGSKSVRDQDKAGQPQTVSSDSVFNIVYGRKFLIPSPKFLSLPSNLITPWWSIENILILHSLQVEEPKRATPASTPYSEDHICLPTSFSSSQIFTSDMGTSHSADSVASRWMEVG